MTTLPRVGLGLPRRRLVEQITSIRSPRASPPSTHPRSSACSHSFPCTFNARKTQPKNTGLFKLLSLFLSSFAPATRSILCVCAVILRVMIDCQNLTAPAHQHCHSAQSAFLDLFQTRIAEKRAYDDEESRVSTDSELYLDSEDEDLDVDDYRTTYSTFSAFYHLQRLQEQQDNQEDENARADRPIRPPLLTTADDSFMAKMDRVKRWVCSVSMAPSEAASTRGMSDESFSSFN